MFRAVSSDIGFLMNLRVIIETFRRNVTDHYFDLQGRVSRQEFWRFVLVCVVIYFIAFIVEEIIRRRLLTPVIGLALLLPIAGLGARRLQDTGRNGMLIWAYSIPTAILELVSLAGAYGPNGMSVSLYSIFMLACLVWLVAAIAFAWLWAQPGTAGINAYGPDPKAAIAAA
ncbi:MAG TPA: DUF805 domain-containing protein [Rhizomicrobium sp.]|nr:DUF805 domain-containing protein [Rhizomicrobium sp.]